MREAGHHGLYCRICSLCCLQRGFASLLNVFDANFGSIGFVVKIPEVSAECVCVLEVVSDFEKRVANVLELQL